MPSTNNIKQFEVMENNKYIKPEVIVVPLESPEMLCLSVQEGDADDSEVL